MAARNRARSNQPSRNTEEAAAADSWFASADSHYGGVAAWDVKAEFAVEVILALLGSGRNIGFYTAWHGEALNLIVYDGESKHRLGIKDAIEFDAAFQQIYRKLQREGKVIPIH